MPPGRSNQSAERMLRVLDKFIERPGSWGVTELSQELGMTKNLVYRSLSLLVASGLVVRDPTGARYAIGFGVLALGRGAASADIRVMSRPFLERLHALSGESVMLSIIVGHSRVNIDGIEARGPRVTHVQRGHARPLHITGNARVLLAFLSDDDIRKYMEAAAPLDRYGEGRIKDEAALWTEIRKIRRLGYAITDRENVLGTPSGTYVSFPVLDGAGRPHAAVTVGGPAERFTLKKANAFIDQMRDVMIRLNEQARMIPAAPAFFVESLKK